MNVCTYPQRGGTESNKSLCYIILNLLIIVVFPWRMSLPSRQTTVGRQESDDVPKTLNEFRPVTNIKNVLNLVLIIWRLSYNLFLYFVTSYVIHIIYN